MHSRPDDEDFADQIEQAFRAEPQRFRKVLGLETEEDRATEQVRVEALETWRLNGIRQARLLREAGNG